MILRITRRVWFIFGLGVFVTACLAGPVLPNEPAATLLPSIETSRPATVTRRPAPIVLPESSPRSPATAGTAETSVTTTLTPMPWSCSPLQDVSLPDLDAMISNLFSPPAPGSDEPHQGVDFADRQPGSQVALAGRAVQAVLGGRVAGIIQNRFPYGNAVLIETPLEEFPAPMAAALNLPGLTPTLEPRSALTCPDAPALEVDEERRSVYLLYAHMAETPMLEVDEFVSCGQILGAIGASGNALNPHLHLEARAGPSGARFSSIAHYDTSATEQEMSNYCTWRVSNLFQVVDPLRLLSLEE